MKSGGTRLGTRLERTCEVKACETWSQGRTLQANENLGLFLPCDYMFGDHHRMVEPFDSHETIRPAGVDADRRLDPVELTAENIPLILPEQGIIGSQSHGAKVWQLVIDFSKAICKLLVRSLMCR
jgi:hypothetical protein